MPVSAATDGARADQSETLEKTVKSRQIAGDSPPDSFEFQWGEGLSKSYWTRTAEKMQKNYHDHVKRAELLAKRERGKRGPSAEVCFTKTLDLLDRSAVAGSESLIRREEIVRLPNHSRASFKGDFHQNQLEILQRTGCEVQIVPCSEDSQEFQALILKGTRAERNVAIHTLPDLMDVKDPPVDASLRKSPNGSKIRIAWHRKSSIWSGHRVNSLTETITKHLQGSDNKNLTLSDLRPDLNSAIAFTNYVHDLTHLPPRLLRIRMSQSDPTGRTFLQSVFDELLTIFSIRSLSNHVTSDSASTALKFIYTHSQHRLARDLLSNLITNSNHKLNAPIFHLMLHAAAKSEDIFTFHRILKTMLHHQIQPDIITFLSLHRLTCRCFPRRTSLLVLDRMRHRGILHSPKGLREAALHRITQDLAVHLTQPNTTIQQFFTLYDNLFPYVGKSFCPRHRAAPEPRPWLTTSAANKMIHHLLLKGRVADANFVLTKLRRAGEYPDTVTLNTFLAAAKRNGDFSAALSALAAIGNSRVKARPRVMLDETSFGILMEIAWRARCYNAVRVVWRYACCVGRVNWNVERRVRESLGAEWTGIRTERRGSVGKQRIKLDEVFNILAGKFAVGAGEVGLSEGLTAQEEAILRVASLEADGDAFGNERAKVLTGIFENDLAQTGRVFIPVQFTILLEKAWLKDLRWGRKKRMLGLYDRRVEGEIKRVGDVPIQERKEMFLHMLGEMYRFGIRVPAVRREGVRGVWA
ncbi:hypothetical protein K470DRAFT_271758 [Piedraia hortae CBS 480.64]|uniref:Pentatricopeptide repeat domain-containing protein n=1 Tax=Piedraia hortae CBS 480.64 TaxID=1314780 RepID=A0A6A7BW32_9PEZI|nr:hypothetical protein K470DRAFT_271758 [Piedraia hortae CBS 480.64]